jgi:hypothetical protein
MKKNIFILFASLMSCNMSDYSQKLSGGYVYVNEGEGLSQILPNSKKVKSIKYVKKYYDGGSYLCVWQADTLLFNSKNFNYGKYKKSTLYSKDLFYIIDVKKDSLLGPYSNSLFLSKSAEVGIFIKWKP